MTILVRVQALWFSFMLPEDPLVSHMHAPNSSVPPLREQRGLCVVESKAIRFFCEHDDDYGTSLPFQVRTVNFLFCNVTFMRVYRFYGRPNV